MTATRDASRFWVLALVLACVGCVVYFFNIWASGFSMSEGHRVAPAWEMLSKSDWLLPHMFEQAYLRKPPGMPWAIAGMTWIFGQNEWAARSVSGSAMIIGAMVSAWYARRWFGNSAGMAAGLAHLLLPWMWESGRAAEIESLNNLGTALAVWGTVDLVSGKDPRRAASIVVMVMGIVVAALAKGPASVPVVLAAPFAACCVARGVSPLKSRGLWIGAGAACVVTGLIAVLIQQRLAREAGDVVMQGVDEFLWSREKVMKIMALPAVFFVSAMPASIAIVPALIAKELGIQECRIARTLAMVAAIAVAVYTLAGVSNPRYTLPAAAVLSPLAGFALLTWKLQAGVDGAVGRWARLFVGLARPAVIVLLIGAVAYALLSENRRDASSGRASGIALGDAVETDSLIIANDMIEARPEVFLYAMSRAAEQQKSLRVKWIPALKEISHGDLPIAKNLYILVRTDSGSDELAAVRESGMLGELQLTAFHCEVGAVNRKFTGTLFRVRR